MRASLLTAFVTVLAAAASGCRDQPAPLGPIADVVSVEASGEPGAYTFAVGIASPDTGCERYADWWEVLGDDGELLHRRVLSHSHVDEQPFVRSGGPVAIEPDRVVKIRAHMYPDGYGGRVWIGSVADGFTSYESSEPLFAALDLEGAEPQPPACRF